MNIKVILIQKSFSFLALLLVALLLPMVCSAASMSGRPVPDGEGPTIIRCAIAILDVDEISDANQNFTANVFARFEWEDPREAHGGTGRLTKALGEVPLGGQSLTTSVVAAKDVIAKIRRDGRILRR